MNPVIFNSLCRFLGPILALSVLFTVGEAPAARRLPRVPGSCASLFLDSERRLLEAANHSARKSSHFDVFDPAADFFVGGFRHDLSLLEISLRARLEREIHWPTENRSVLREQAQEIQNAIVELRGQETIDPMVMVRLGDLATEFFERSSPTRMNLKGQLDSASQKDLEVIRSEFVPLLERMEGLDVISVFRDLTMEDFNLVSMKPVVFLGFVPKAGKTDGARRDPVGFRRHDYNHLFNFLFKSRFFGELAVSKETNIPNYRRFTGLEGRLKPGPDIPAKMAEREKFRQRVFSHPNLIRMTEGQRLAIHGTWFQLTHETPLLNRWDLTIDQVAVEFARFFSNQSRYQFLHSRLNNPEDMGKPGVRVSGADLKWALDHISERFAEQPRQ